MDKDQLAYEQYGVKYEDCEVEEQEALDARYDDQEGADEEPVALGSIAVEFGRPGINGTKKSIVAAGTNVLDASNQAGMSVRVNKESFQVKESNHYDVGQTLTATDSVYDGDLILIVTGVDSAN